MSKTLYILHDNIEWIHDLCLLLTEKEVTYKLWFLDQASKHLSIDFSLPPPEGVYFNRISCSSHTRGNTYSVNFSQQVLQWLETYQRPVINGSTAFQIEISKTYQSILLAKHQIKSPMTWTCTYPESITKAANSLEKFPIIIKDNQGGSGSGVYKLDSFDKLEKHLEARVDKTSSPDGLTLVQEYIENPERKIYRVEFINYQYLYTLQVLVGDTFNLCPATSCQLENCPLKRSDAKQDGEYKFTIVQGVTPTWLLDKYADFAKSYGLEVVAFEYTMCSKGDYYTYDINCNTNYNSDAETRWRGKNYGNLKLLELFRANINRL